MSAPGWYPDPAGGAGQRWWDGSAWTGRTRGPGGSTGGPGPNPSARTAAPWGWILGGVAALIAIIIAVVLIMNRPSGPREITDGDYPTASSTVSAWDDSDPDDTTSPSPEPSPSDTPPGSNVPCPEGDPNQRQDHPQDATRVYGGNLSFALAEGFDPPLPEPRFTIAHDVTQQVAHVAPDDNWIAQLAVGRLRAADGFTGSPEKVATALAQCTASSDLYAPYTQELKITGGEAITVSGQKGWRIDADIRVEQGPAFGGDKVVFVVVPDGDDWGMFFGAVPLGDGQLAGQMEDTVASLRTV
ncbi:DUF2510 domain-containing protein [Propionibacteriaceae bacterium Y1700]|uniref:DUF2510 domain-containing protein n=1 Tax=Microlunatus sp. Y1700 TaxID=3418487 RepID=UPI003DA79E8D